MLVIISYSYLYNYFSVILLVEYLHDPHHLSCSYFSLCLIIKCVYFDFSYKYLKVIEGDVACFQAIV